MDGPHFPQGRPEIAGISPPFLGTPIQTLIAAKDGPDLALLAPIRMWCVNGVRKSPSLAEIRVSERESSGESSG